MPVQIEADAVIERFLSAEPYDIKGETYSWGKTARLQTEPYFMEVYSRSNADLLAVDICSSYPHLRQIMLGQHKQRMLVEAKKVVGRLVDDLHAPERKNKLPFTATLDSNERVALRNMLSPRGGIGRQLLTAPVFDTLVNPPLAKPVDFGDSYRSVNMRGAQAIAGSLCARFQKSDLVIQEKVEPEGKRGDQKAWMWIMATEKQTVYVPAESRGKGIAKEMYGDSRAQVMTDGYGGYTSSIPQNKHLFCWAHVLRFAFEETIHSRKSSMSIFLRDELVRIYHVKKLHPQYPKEKLEAVLTEELNKLLVLSSKEQSFKNT